jgi:hypothetical protein
MIRSEAPRTQAEWGQLVGSLMKANMKLAQIGYRELAARLADLGIDQTPANLSGKFAHGRFSATLMLQVLTACGVTALPLPIASAKGGADQPD